MFSFEQEAETFIEYTRQVILIKTQNLFYYFLFQLEEALIILRNLKREEYESQTTLKILRFLENLIHQPKEWISGAKLKLAEMKFPGGIFFLFQFIY